MRGERELSLVRGKGTKLGEGCPKVRLSQDSELRDYYVRSGLLREGLLRSGQLRSALSMLSVDFSSVSLC